MKRTKRVFVLSLGFGRIWDDRLWSLYRASGKTGMSVLEYNFCHDFCFLTPDLFVFAHQGPPGLPGPKGSKVRFIIAGALEEIAIYKHT